MIRHTIAPAIGLLAMLLAPLGIAQDIPDAFSVEWQGKKPCEKLYEDAQIRIGRCIFPPGAVHVRHSHPASFGYVLSGGKDEVRDARGTRVSEPKTGAFGASPPTAWHEVTNVGDTTLVFLVVEKKYQPVPKSAR